MKWSNITHVGGFIFIEKTWNNSSNCITGAWYVGRCTNNSEILASHFEFFYSNEKLFSKCAYLEKFDFNHSNWMNFINLCSDMRHEPCCNFVYSSRPNLPVHRPKPKKTWNSGWSLAMTKLMVLLPFLQCVRMVQSLLLIHWQWHFGNRYEHLE